MSGAAKDGWGVALVQIDHWYEVSTRSLIIDELKNVREPEE